jgi:hypothetical protein
MLESPSSTTTEDSKVSHCKNKICGAILDEAFLANFLMLLILEFSHKLHPACGLQFTNNFEIKQFIYLTDRREFSHLSNRKPDPKWK